MRMRMKKLLAAAGCCLLLAGCSHSGAEQKSEAAARTVTFDFTCRESYTDSGTVYLEEDILHFTDAESGLDAVICPKADCKHEGESLQNPHPTCSGWVEGINTSCPMIVGDRLYFIYTPTQSDGGYGGFMEKRLCRAAKDGTDRRDIAELHGAEAITAAFYDSGRLAVAYRSTFDDKGESLEKSRSFVSVIDLESGEATTSGVIEEFQGIITKLWSEGSTVYFCSSYTTEDIDFDKWDPASKEFEEYLDGICRADIMSMDTDTGEVRTLYSVNYCGGIGWGCALVTGDAPRLIDLSDGSERALEGIGADCGLTLCSEGVIIYDSAKGEYSLCSFGGGDPKQIYKTEQKEFIITAVTDGLIYVSYGSNETYGLGVMDRAAFLGGKGADIRRLRGAEY